MSRENIPANIRTKFYSDYVPLMSTWEKGAGETLMRLARE